MRYISNKNKLALNAEIERKRHEMYLEKANNERIDRDKKIGDLEDTSEIKYSPKNDTTEPGRDPFASPPGISVVSPPTNNGAMSDLPIRVTSASNGTHRSDSKYYSGEALDITPIGHGGLPYTGTPLAQEDPEAYGAYKDIHAQLEGMGLKVVDEYSKGGKVSSHGSARHIHVEGTEDQISDVLSRAQVVKSGVVPFTGTRPKKQQSAIGKLNAANAKVSKKKDTPPSITMSSNSSPQVSITVPEPTVIVNKDMDSSFNGWAMMHEMMLG
jgi:hypothetical protein